MLFDQNTYLLDIGASDRKKGHKSEIKDRPFLHGGIVCTQLQAREKSKN